VRSLGKITSVKLRIKISLRYGNKMFIVRVKNSSDVIPVETTRVEVANKKIERLPSLPVGLTQLNCSYCTSLHELPPLPKNLTELYCSDCTSLRELPPLPIGLTRLICSGCTSLRKLPSLSHCVGLIWLDCPDCISLCELPPLPKSLKWLDCYDCTSLRELPPLLHCVGLTQLYCFRCTSIRELPPLPKSLTQLNCNDCTSLLYSPIIPDTCNIYYRSHSLPTKEKYFEEINMGKNQEFIASRGDELLYVIIGKDITDVVKGYLS
jgi:hypothetical protein